MRCRSAEVVGDGVRQCLGNLTKQLDACRRRREDWLFDDEFHEDGEFFCTAFVMVVECQVDAFHFEALASVEVNYGHVSALGFADDLT